MYSTHRTSVTLSFTVWTVQKWYYRKGPSGARASFRPSLCVQKWLNQSQYVPSLIGSLNHTTNLFRIENWLFSTVGSINLCMNTAVSNRINHAGFIYTSSSSSKLIQSLVLELSIYSPKTRSAYLVRGVYLKTSYHIYTPRVLFIFSISPKYK